MTVLSGLEFKVKYGTEFYKVLADDLKHHDFTYQVGLNIDHNKFNHEMPSIQQLSIVFGHSQICALC